MDNCTDRFLGLNIQTAEGLSPQQAKKNLKLFTSLLTNYANYPCNINKRSLVKWFRDEILDKKYPEFYEELLNRFPKHSICLRLIFKYLFPTPNCGLCGIQLKPLSQQSTCNKYCLSYLKYGVSNKNQLPEMREKFKQSSETLMSDFKLRKRISRKVSKYFHNLDPTKKADVIANMRIGNAAYWKSLSTEERSKLGRIWWESLSDLDQFSFGLMVSNGWKSKSFEEVDAWKAAISASIKGRSNLAKKITRESRRITCLAKYGVSHPMLDFEIFLKNRKSAFAVKKGVYKNRVYKYQGWENTLIEELIDIYGCDSVFTQFDVGFPRQVIKGLGIFPDIFVSTTNTFFEVKSTFTLFSTSNGDLFKVVVQKAKKLFQAGLFVKYAVVLNPKKKIYIILPEKWFLTMNRSQVRNFLKNNTNLMSIID